MLATGFNWWLPPNISTHGGRIDQLIVLTHWFMAVLFVGWGIYLTYCLIRFRSRPGHQPSTKLPKAKVSKYAEVVVIIVEAVLLLGFSIPIWAHVRGSGHVPDAEDDPLVVRVVAKQFEWFIHYPGRDGKFGRSHDLWRREGDPAATLGLMRGNPEDFLSEEQIELISGNPASRQVLEPDPAAADDIITANQFHLPVNREVLVHLTSMDVIHSFGLPLLRIKQDVVPGMTIPVWFKADQTTDEVRDAMTLTFATVPEELPALKNHVAMAEYKAPDGTVIVERLKEITKAALDGLSAAGIREIKAAPAVPTEIACAQLCGLGHYRMRGYIHIDNYEQYTEWMAKEEAWLADQEEEEY